MIIGKIIETLRSIRQISGELHSIRAALGRIEARQLACLGPEAPFGKSEFRVFSQWGEDGILQHIFRHCPPIQPVFVEFGVENYLESNTRLLLSEYGWSGLVIDGSSENIDFIRRDPIYWKHNLKAVAAFIDRDNINSLLREHGLTGPIGLLSVDIDGNDYWVWQAIEVVNPGVVICEYNAIFGSSAAITVPYRANFQRGDAHFSHLYFGASLAALEKLGKRKGYSLVATNRNGCNAFFVRTDLLGPLKEISAAEAFQPSTFRESRHTDGTLTHLTPQAGLKLISHLPIFDLSRDQITSIADALSENKF